MIANIYSVPTPIVEVVLSEQEINSFWAGVSLSPLVDLYAWVIGQTPASTSIPIVTDDGLNLTSDDGSALQT